MGDTIVVRPRKAASARSGQQAPSSASSSRSCISRADGRGSRQNGAGDRKELTLTRRAEHAFLAEKGSDALAGIKEIGRMRASAAARSQLVAPVATRPIFSHASVRRHRYPAAPIDALALSAGAGARRSTPRTHANMLWVVKPTATMVKPSSAAPRRRPGHRLAPPSRRSEALERREIGRCRVAEADISEVHDAARRVWKATPAPAGP